VAVTGIAVWIMRSPTEASDRFADRWPTAAASNLKRAALHPANTNASPPLLMANVVREFPSPVSLAPPVVAEEPAEAAVAENLVVEEPKIEPALTTARETEFKRHWRKKFSHRRRHHHAIRRYAYYQ